ncbi:hypothetical protein F4821DRAFT_194871 [Hypoxylon rubiginosum]|uniref:Uncharacterized protein n=1 Tax=Hypoxylon rubiginosum TaxID=110542 RepID=A0ACC0CS44_9PEZI|nr:hypothetical protein F4821DRAFT_194871 [Hypoxylon rubiginosum]
MLLLLSRVLFLPSLRLFRRLFKLLLPIYYPIGGSVQTWGSSGTGIRDAIPEHPNQSIHPASSLCPGPLASFTVSFIFTPHTLSFPMRSTSTSIADNESLNYITV